MADKTGRSKFLTSILGLALAAAGSATAHGPHSAPDTGTPDGGLEELVNAMLADPAAAPPPDDAIARLHTSPNRAMFNDAAARADDILSRVDSVYSRQLKAESDRLTRYLHDHDLGRHSDVAIIDPLRVDIARALGASPLNVLHNNVATRRFADRLSPDVMNSAHDDLMVTIASPAGTVTRVLSPMALMHFGDSDARPCLVSPATPQAQVVRINGFSTQESIAFFNKHEGWHCIDTINRQQQHNGLMQGTNANNPVTLFDTHEKRQVFSTIHRSEMLADVAAAGDMIADGHRIGIIDDLSAFRKSISVIDPMHFSSPGLDALKEHIDTVGVDAFRGMDDPQRRGLYFDITENYALSPDMLKTAAAYAYGDSRTQRDIRRQAKNDAVAQKALVYADRLPQDGNDRNMARAAQHLEDGAIRLSRRDMRALSSFDAEKTLTDTAFAQSGAVTPDSVIDAYVRLQDGLMRDMAGSASPKDTALAQEKMVLLQTTFIKNLRVMDFEGLTSAYRAQNRPATPPVAPKR